MAVRHVQSDGHNDPVLVVRQVDSSGNAMDSAGAGSASTEIQYRNGSNALTSPSPTNPLPTTNSAIGATTDAESTTDGSLVALLKRLRTLLSGGLPATLTSGGSLRTSIQETATTGSQGNLWSAAAVSAAGTSTATTVTYGSIVTFFGNVSAATNLTVQISVDGTNWYDSDIVIAVAGAGNFAKTVESGASRFRLKSSAAATITATAASKL